MYCFPGKNVDKNYLFDLKSSYRGEFSELRAPVRLSRFKKLVSEEKTMTKSCETMLKCLEPYQNYWQTRKKIELSPHIDKNLLMKSFSVKRKATRKFQFFSFCEEAPITQPLSTGYDKTYKYIIKIVDTDKITILIYSVLQLQLLDRYEMQSN